MLGLWISFLTVIGCVFSFNLSYITNEKSRFTLSFENLLLRIKSESPYESIFFTHRHLIECVDEDLQSTFPVPFIRSVAYRIVLLKQDYNSQLLAVVCLRRNYEEQLNILAHNLKHIRDTKILTIVSQKMEEKFGEHLLLSYFEKCETLKFVNVNLIYYDFMDTQVYHSYTQFPDFALEVHSLATNKTFYSYRLGNLYGKELLTIPDLVEPRTMLLKDAGGHNRMIGYIGRLLNTFAKKHNITWKFWFDIDEHQVLPLTDVREAVRNGSVEIGASLSSPMVHLNVHEYSYPVEVVKWGIMLPTEQSIPMHSLLLSAFSVQLYLIIFILYWLLSIVLTLQQLEHNNNEWHVIFTSIVFNDVAVRGILGQSFRMKQLPKLALKFIYFLIFIAGLVVSTAYSANLMRLIVTPPTKSRIDSFDDLLNKGLKVVISAKEVSVMTSFNGKAWWDQYNSVFEVEESPEKFQTRRNSFDTRFGYSIVTSTWPMIEEQQRHFQRRSFRYAPELAFNNCHLFALPINPESIFREALDLFIHRVRDAGLFSYWFSMTLYDMVRMGKLTFKDPSESQGFQQLTVLDFYWIWMLYFTGIAVSAVQFILEKFCAAAMMKIKTGVEMKI